MGKLLTSICILLSVLTFAQTQSFDYQNSYIIKFNLIENKDNKQEIELNSAILRNTNAYFCIADYSKRTLTVVLNKNFDHNQVINALNELGFEAELDRKVKFTDDLFIELYLQFKYVTYPEGSDLPKAQTRNPDKDNANYQKATEILNQ